MLGAFYGLRTCTLQMNSKAKILICLDILSFHAPEYIILPNNSTSLFVSN